MVTGKGTARATFGAGCFWYVEEAFRKVEGVLGTKVGYLGGSASDPSYEDVCTGRTGHAEVCRVEFDPKKVSYGELLDLFWSMHDPTQLDRQGPDIGPQYRSVIFFHDERQKKLALRSREERQKRMKDRIVTEIAPAGRFFAAEGYHQKYLKKRGLKSCF